MKEITLFIASSCEMEDWRIALGDAVRVWSADLEKRGVRLRLNCWEDLHPEFTGERKQDEYDEELVRTSDIFIGLFWHRCGGYTCGEIRLGRTVVDPGSFHVMRRRRVYDTPEIDSFISSEGITATEVDCLDAFLAAVRQAVESHICTAGRNRPARPVSADKRMYLTLSPDCESLRVRVGNMIRSLDQMAERRLALRCRLDQLATEALAYSDYYLAVLKDELSTANREELAKGLLSTDPAGNPQLSVIYTDGAGKAVCDPLLRHVIDTKGIFTERFAGIHQLKLNLLVWLLKCQTLQVDEQSGIGIADEWITFFGLKVAPLSLYDGVRSIDYLYFKLSMEMIFGRGATATSVDGPDRDSEIDRVRKEIALADKLREDAVGRLRSIGNQLDAEINAMASDIHRADKRKFVDSLFRKIDIEEQLLAQGAGNPSDLLATQFMLVRAYDSFEHVFEGRGFDIDSFYGVVASTADNHGILDPVAEVMRMNYANYFARYGRFNEALSLYDRILDNFDRMDDSSQVIRNYISFVYTNYANMLSSLSINDMAMEVVRRYQSKAEAWDASPRALTDTLADKARIYAMILRMRPMADGSEIYLERAAELLQRLGELNPLGFDPKIRDDVYLDLPIVIAAYRLDSDIAYRSREDYQATAGILNSVIGNAARTDCFVKETAGMFIAKAYHNIARLAEPVEGTLVARLWATRALDIRRKLYAADPNDMNLFFVRESLLLAGATYINNTDSISPDDAREATNIAQECLRISEQRNTENHLGQVTDIYQAKLLVATIMFKERGGNRAKAVELLKECLDWDRRNPGNSYHDVIESECRHMLGN